MFRWMLHGLASSALLVAGLGFASPAAASDQRASENKVICKREAPTGTRFAKKTCRTKKEREQIAEQHKRDAGEVINRPVIYRCEGPSC